jgi:outer membrane protein
MTFTFLLHCRRKFACNLSLALLIVLGGVVGQSALAADEPAKAGGWAGTAAIGPLAFPRYAGGRGTQVWAVPLLSINYEETFYVEIQRMGVYVLSSADKKLGLGLAVEPRFGFSAKDGPRLAGMSTRKTGLDGGLMLDWDIDVLAFSIAQFGDLNRSSRGRSQRFSVYRPLVKDDRWEFGALLAADRMDAKVANYYFGIPAAESTASRPAYRPGTTTNVSLGVSGTRRIDAHGALIFGANITRLGGEAARSPITETRRAAIYYLGYGWAF